MKYIYKIYYYFESVLTTIKLYFISERLFSTYLINTTNPLTDLMELHGSDKGSNTGKNTTYSWDAHTYTDFYNLFFSQSKEYIHNLLEIGIGTNKIDYDSSMGVSSKPGASLRAWKQYFPNALIYGCDIDKSILFKEDRINCFFIDQLIPETITDFINLLPPKLKFDIIIDDGLHTFEAGTNSFLNLFASLSDNGFYIIEDVSNKDLLRYKKFFSKVYGVNCFFIRLSRNRIINRDNNLIIISNSF